MATVKWIKVDTGIFDDEKILLIESLPEADSIIVIWFKLLTLAGKQNNNGVFTMNDRIAYTDDMLATIFRRNVNTVKLALTTFEQFGMIEIINDTVTIPNWSKHQSLEQLKDRNEYMKNYMQKYREKQKVLTENVNSKVNSKPNVNLLEEEKNKNKNKNKNNDIDVVMSAWNDLDDNVQKITSINPGTKRYDLLKARINQYGLDDVIKAIESIDDSKFLKGYVTDFNATFDWFVKPNNFIKVLEGNYQDKKSNDQKQSKDNYTKEYVAKKLKDDDYAPR